ncbi:alpha-galactosidase [Pedobacter sp. L105]|uniref:alpha-galactosidase n=1 Tax=Pedobacter sp. L105 TaxID=1641871 RepID=UPI00131BB6CD|nr:alpha-galactosidase [Pedobacter sp. L105]
MFKKLTVIVLIALTTKCSYSLPFHRVLAPSQTIHILYGHGNEMIYSLKSGTMDVIIHQKAILYQLYGVVKTGGKTISSKDYTLRTYKQIPITDHLGKGIKHIVTLSGAGLPEMRQVFYTYPGRVYFFAEIELRGNNLSTNYMAPLVGQFMSVGNEARTLFVPFDNDTFISYDAKPFAGTMVNTSSEVGTVYDNKSRAGIVTGSVEHGLWKTGVKTSAGKGSAPQLEVWGGYTEESVTRDSIPHGMVSGDVVKSPKVFLGFFPDWRQGLEEYAKVNRLLDPPYVFNWKKPTPVGWNSWGVMQDKLTYAKAVKVVDFFADSLAGFRVGHTAFIDLDSYWDKLVTNGDDRMLKQFADYCKSKGLEPGIYWAPFTDWGDKNNGDRKVEGSNYHYSDLWTKVGKGYHDLDGARALDPTHPGTKQRITWFMNRFKACGFKMIKIDFLGHAAIESDHFYDPRITTGMQAYREGMEYVVNQLDSKMFIYAAISPSLATGRYVHSRRIACDAFKTIAHTSYTLNSLNYGWWQTYLYNYVDADHIVFANEPIGVNRARLLSSIITGTMITGDDFSVHGPWSSRAGHFYQDKELLRLVQNGKAFRPVEGDSGNGTSEMFTKQIGPDFYLAVFNYGTKAKNYPINLKRIGLSPAGHYQISELLQHGAVPITGSMHIRVNGADAVLYKFTRVQH